MNNTKDIRKSQGLLRAASRGILAPDRVQYNWSIDARLAVGTPAN